MTLSLSLIECTCQIGTRIERIPWIHRELSIISTHICTAYVHYLSRLLHADALSLLAKFIQQPEIGIWLLFPSHIIANAINAVLHVHLRENLLYATGCIAPTFRAISHSTVFPADHVPWVHNRVGSRILSYPIHARYARIFLLLAAGLETASRDRLSNAINVVKTIKTIKPITIQKKDPSKRFAILKLRMTRDEDHCV